MEASVSLPPISKVSLPDTSSGLNNVHVHKVMNGNDAEYFAIFTKEGNISNKLDDLSDVATIHGVVQGESFNLGVKNENLPKYLSNC